MDTTTAEDARHGYAFPEATGVTAPEPGTPLGGAALNPEPAVDEVLREQFAAVGLALRREGFVVAGTMTVFTAVVLAMQTQEGLAHIPLDPGMGIATAMMALLMPMAVWKGEGPEQRGYHHSMPVDEAGHAMMRTGAGLAWTLAGVTAFFAWIGLLSVATGGGVASAEPWQWAAPFVGATVLYLLGSALTLVTSHPWRWLGGGAVAFLFLGAFRAVDALRPLVDALGSILSGRYGIFTLLTGLAENVPDAGAWLASAGIWIIVAVGAFVAAAHRQPEQ